MGETKRLLVVDDDVDFADSLAELLEGEGWEVTVAYDGATAVGMFADQTFDCTLLDVQMPGQNGVESLVEILRVSPAATVVMMTGYSVPTLLDRAVEAGAAAVLSKPIDFARLKDLVLASGPRPLVLVADDDPDFVASLGSLLGGAGLAVVSASSGEDAIAQAMARSPDILLLDLRMPGMSGVQAYRELERLGILPPTIVVSAYLDEEGAGLAGLESLPTEHVVAKPVDSRRLLALVARVTGAGAAG